VNRLVLGEKFEKLTSTSNPKAKKTLTFKYLGIEVQFAIKNIFIVIYVITWDGYYDGVWLALVIQQITAFMGSQTNKLCGSWL